MHVFLPIALVYIICLIWNLSIFTANWIEKKSSTHVSFNFFRKRWIHLVLRRPQINLNLYKRISSYLFSNRYYFLPIFFLGRMKISSTVWSKMEIMVKMDRFHIRETIYTWKSTLHTNDDQALYCISQFLSYSMLQFNYFHESRFHNCVPFFAKISLRILSKIWPHKQILDTNFSYVLNLSFLTFREFSYVVFFLYVSEN